VPVSFSLSEQELTAAAARSFPQTIAGMTLSDPVIDLVPGSAQLTATTKLLFVTTQLAVATTPSVAGGRVVARLDSATLGGVGLPDAARGSMVRSKRIRLDMHTHCEYSPDGETPVAEQARVITAAGLDVVCATDHNTIEGALRLRELADGFRVIVGEEVSTREGELIGLFLERPVPRDRSAEETIALIHEQGGLVSVPHPFSHNRPTASRTSAGPGSSARTSAARTTFLDALRAGTIHGPAAGRRRFWFLRLPRVSL